MMTHLCEICGKSFQWKSYLKRHRTTTHIQTKKFKCQLCHKSYGQLGNLLRHYRIDHPEVALYCHPCGTVFTSKEQKDGHLCVRPRVSGHKRKGSKIESPSKRTTFRCHTCLDAFDSRSLLYQHKQTVHPSTDLRHDNLFEQPFLRPDGSVDADVEKELKINLSHILQPHHIDDTISLYNFPIRDLESSAHLCRLISEVINMNIDNAVKFNVTFGLLLRHKETSRARYFVGHNNNSLFDLPVRVDRPNITAFLKDLVTDEIIHANVRHARPDTKWSLVCVTNVVITVYHLDIPLGAPLDLPKYISDSKSLVGLNKMPHSNDYFDDNLCAFRCLAFHQARYKRFEQRTLGFAETWKVSHPEFDRGVNLHQMHEFEETFQISVDVYSMTPEGGVIPRYLSGNCHNDKMVLNVYENHLSYVTKPAAYLKKFQCDSCKRHFTHLGTWKRHNQVCSNAVKTNLPGGYFNSSSSVFESLEKHGIFVDHSRRFYPWFAVFDFEAVLLETDETNTEKLRWTRRHEAVSVSVASNLEGFSDAVNFIDRDEDMLLSHMVNHLKELSSEAYEKAKEKWEDVLVQLDQTIEDSTPPEPVEIIPLLQPSDGVEAYINQDRNVHEKSLRDHDYQVNQSRYHESIKRLKSDFHAYLCKLPVLGFNSANYDLNLVKHRLMGHLVTAEGKFPSVIKTNNAYRSVSNDKLIFLDISNFLSPGCSLSQFLKAFNTTEEKSYFPYEWFDSKEKLDDTSLPSYEAFYSTLKNVNVLDAEHLTWAEQANNVCPDEYEKWLEKHPEPSTGQQNYQTLCAIWVEKGMTQFSEFLAYYNDMDVSPFVEAVEKLLDFYKAMNVDVFKSTISVPGVSRKLLFTTSREMGVYFSLFSNKDEDLYYTVKSNIIGGPSIIYNRSHKVDETFIRENPEKPVKNILGYDANALYLWALDQPMPTGQYIRRLREDKFKPQNNYRHEAMFHYMDYLSLKTSFNFRHARNCETGEVRIGPYLVDGYDGSSKTIFEFNGCYFHAHTCYLTEHVKDKQLMKKRAANTEQRQKYLEKQGYTVLTVTECEYLIYLDNDTELKRFVEERQPTFYRERSGQCEESAILDAVRSELLFGMVECDIRVPDHLYEEFSEMSPIFCTSDVPFTEFGPHMQNYVRDKELSQKPRRVLVGGMSGEKLLLATPLLKWYLEKGIEVTHVYQVIEYVPSSCFKPFVEKVSEARRAGDVDPDKAIIADSMKLLGNSAYGSLLINKAKYKNINYVTGMSNAKLAFNKPLFVKACELDKDIFEIETLKSKLELNTPVHLGYFVLQMAKLRMLSFYYDCLSFYVDRVDFELIEMDTDSLYFAISGDDLAAIVKPRLKTKFDAFLNMCHYGKDFTANPVFWFPRICCTEHEKYDKRSPGLFKLEASGTEMIALCSKTYLLKQHDDSLKISSKGVNKKSIEDPLDTFRSVLDTGNSECGTNKGFRVKNNTMFSYEQTRSAISYFYCKRIVGDDGVSTRPLPITLTPYRDYNVCVLSKKDSLHWDALCYVGHAGNIFRSLRKAYLYTYVKFHGRDEVSIEIVELEKLSNEVSPSHVWFQKRDSIMLDLLKTQLGRVRDTLVDTGDKIIVVSGVREKYWTSDMNLATTSMCDPKLYRGQNKLGQLWMKLRDEINAS